MTSQRHLEMRRIATAMGAFAVKDFAGNELGPTGPTAHGEWHDPMYVQMMDRAMRMLFDMRFTDKRGVNHIVPAGAVINGADIPRVLWTPVGPPMAGPYVRSSALHDVALTQMPPEPAHQLFYESMLADGCTQEQADLFWHAVTAKTWWDRMHAMRRFFSSAWQVLRRVLPTP